MARKTRMHWLIPIALMCALSGCSSGGSNGGFLSRALRLNINWGAQGRAAVKSPQSAQSARIVLVGAAPNEGDLVLNVNRNAVDGQATYQFPSGARVGNYPLSVTFYASPNEVGDIVGVAGTTVTIGAKTIDPLAVDLDSSLAVNSVTVAPNQSVNPGETKSLIVTALDINGNMVAVAPGAIVLTTAPIPGTTGQLKTDATGVLVTGVAVGQVNVTATIDRLTSAPVAVTIGSRVASILVTPNQTVNTTETKGLTVTALDSSGAVVSLPDSAFVLTRSALPPFAGQVTTNPNGLQVTGVTAGKVNIAATANGVTSPAAALCVSIANHTVTINPTSTTTVSLTGCSNVSFPAPCPVSFIASESNVTASDPNTTVTVSVDGGSANGTISGPTFNSNTGRTEYSYTPAATKTGTFTVRATGTVDVCKTATFTVTVTP